MALHRPLPEVVGFEQYGASAVQPVAPSAPQLAAHEVFVAPDTVMQLGIDGATDAHSAHAAQYSTQLPAASQYGFPLSVHVLELTTQFFAHVPLTQFGVDDVPQSELVVQVVGGFGVGFVLLLAAGRVATATITITITITIATPIPSCEFDGIRSRPIYTRG